MDDIKNISLFVCLMGFKATFNNISAISWRSVLLVEETEGSEKITDLSQVTDKLYHIKLYTSPWSRFEITTSVVIGTDCIGSCKSNYHRKHQIDTSTLNVNNNDRWDIKLKFVLVFFSFLFSGPVSCMLNVASVSGLSILDCLFGFL